MRLLHSKTLELREFPNHEGIAYAILSHTWDNDEVLFQDLQGFNAETTPPVIKRKSGYKKIEACCAQAARDGFDYVWIDTCCIDKRSSAELSEAINSMYRWYQDSGFCYAYLADVPSGADPETKKKNFRESRWFTRGWTLQELIAPSTVEFYGWEWYTRGQEASLGTKASLQHDIFEITKIPIDVLRGSGLQPCSIAQKMSWAARRETTRIEDIAYCLMGLFNVNMPLLYGEGERAFVRLQEEIMKISADESLFAWRGERPGIHFQGLLAMSPGFFVHSGSITPKITTQRTSPFAVTNMGLRMEVMLHKTSEIKETIESHDPDEDFESLYVAVLNCGETTFGNFVGVLLGCLCEEYQAGTFVRIDPGGLIFIDPNTYQPLESSRKTISVRLAETSDPWALDIFAREKYLEREKQYRALWLKASPKDFDITDAWPQDSWVTDRDFMWIPKLKEKRQGSYIYPSVLLFENMNEAFVVWFGYYLQKPRVQVRRRNPGDSLGDAYEGENIDSLVAHGSDRVTRTLDSGRVVLAFFRPQRANGRFGYGLYVSVSEKE
jgi:hypothetical protein